jgi:UDP-N-acetylglucosamine--N-acetylmuramyl-(pentapeptide) pyrophosphoryl-undecaprenol N-acetylglucosamine transferase
LGIAERLKEIAPNSRSIFVCSNRAIDASMLGEAGADYVPVPASPPSARPVAACRFALSFFRSKRIVAKLIRDRHVTRVVTLGGFVAAPTVSAANSCNVPVMLVNLDSPPGRANLWMAKRSDQVVSAIPLPSMPSFASRVVGMPIRRRALAPGDQRQCRARLGLDPEKLVLFVTGASQGATSINAFMIALATRKPEFFDGWQIYHLAGASADDALRAAYSKAGICAKVDPFFNEIGLAWGAADLAVSRAGASSVAEAAHNAVPTLFLPYPYHKDMHQKHNAQPLADLQSAVIAIDHVDAVKNVQHVGPVLHALMNGNAQRESMRQRLRAHSFPDAARTIAEMLV